MGAGSSKRDASSGADASRLEEDIELANEQAREVGGDQHLLFHYTEAVSEVSGRVARQIKVVEVVQIDRWTGKRVPVVLPSRSLNGHPFREELFENQRCPIVNPFGANFGNEHLYVFDRRGWSDERGTDLTALRASYNDDQFERDWALDTTFSNNVDGWKYALNFSLGGAWSDERKPDSFVRRRRWKLINHSTDRVSKALLSIDQFYALLEWLSMHWKASSASVERAPSGESECGICLERREDTLLPCGHMFCAQCIAEWFCLSATSCQERLSPTIFVHRDSHGGTCPYCRNKSDEDPESHWTVEDVPFSSQLDELILCWLQKLPSDQLELEFDLNSQDSVVCTNQSRQSSGQLGVCDSDGPSSGTIEVAAVHTE